MKTVGRVQSLWRYPVKSMRGHQLQEAFAGFPGIYGDRLYAFVSATGPKGFPWLTGREQEIMLLYRPAFRNPAAAARPVNFAEAVALSPGITTLYPDLTDLMVDVETPSGERLAIDDPRLIASLREGLGDKHQLTLVRSHRAMTDCSPVSIFSLQTARQLGSELGAEVDPGRFRANLYVDLESGTGFGENEFVGRNLRIGATTVIAVVRRDNRCKMITLDPGTAKPNPELMKLLAREHNTQAGVYGAVLVEGVIRPGDDVTLLD